MDLICQMERTSLMFEDKWKHYVDIILKYSQSHPSHNKELKAALSGLAVSDSFSDCGMCIPIKLAQYIC